MTSPLANRALVLVGVMGLGCGGQDDINPFDSNSASATLGDSGLDASSGGASDDAATDVTSGTGDGDGDGSTGDGDGDGCDPQSTMQCVGSDIYWFDCNGVQAEWFAECSTEEFCITDSCVSPDYNGQWLVTADPDTKSFLCGNATFSPTLFDVSVEGAVASAITVNFTPQILLSGDRNGKALNMTGEFTDAQGGVHTIVDNWLFTSPTDFFGTSNESIVVGALNCGNLVWNISGVKQ